MGDPRKDKNEGKRLTGILGFIGLGMEEEMGILDAIAGERFNVAHVDA